MILLEVLLPHHHHHHNHLLKLLLAHLIVLIGQHWSIVHHRGEEVDLGVSHLALAYCTSLGLAFGICTSLGWHLAFGISHLASAYCTSLGLSHLILPHFAILPYRLKRRRPGVFPEYAPSLAREVEAQWDH